MNSKNSVPKANPRFAASGWFGVIRGKWMALKYRWMAWRINRKNKPVSIEPLRFTSKPVEFEYDESKQKYK